jgi:hypothetical protein
MDLLEKKCFLSNINIGENLITFSVLWQAYSMFINKNTKINGYAFILYGFALYFAQYNNLHLYMEKPISLSNIATTVFATLWIIVGILAFVYK